MMDAVHPVAEHTGKADMGLGYGFSRHAFDRVAPNAFKTPDNLHSKYPPEIF
jgi:hypothetical protein